MRKIKKTIVFATLLSLACLTFVAANTNIYTISAPKLQANALSSVVAAARLTENAEIFSNESTVIGSWGNVAVGDDLTAKLYSNGTLKITGIGDMNNWDGVENVPWYWKHSQIKRIELDGHITSIGDFAFYQCENIKEIDIPQSVTKIGNSAFSYSGIEQIEIPNGVQQLGNYVFNTCMALSEITLPASVSKIGTFAFAYCYSLENVRVDQANVAYCDVNGILYNKDKTCLMRYPSGRLMTDFVVPSGVTTLEAYAFDGCSELMYVELPNGLQTIKEHAFDSCYYLSQIRIPKSVTDIGEYSFYNCVSLTNLTLPEGIKRIRPSMFFDCKGLTSIVIPASVNSIGFDAFKYCSNLKSVYYGGTTKWQWRKIDLEDGNFILSNATVYCYKATEPKGNGNYWRWDQGFGTTPVVWTSNNVFLGLFKNLLQGILIFIKSIFTKFIP